MNAKEPSNCRAQDEAPTPIGYRLFDLKTNSWSKGLGGIVLMARRPLTTGSGIEYRPWYGPSLVTE